MNNPLKYGGKASLVGLFLEQMLILKDGLIILCETKMAILLCISQSNGAGAPFPSH